MQTKLSCQVDWVWLILFHILNFYSLFKIRNIPKLLKEIDYINVVQNHWFFWVELELETDTTDMYTEVCAL